MGIVVRPPQVELKNQTPYLGFVADSAMSMRLRYKGPKHLLGFGVPGALKSMGWVVPNLATLRRSMIVIDPKGQLAAITARRRKQFGRVIVLNPFGELLDVAPHLESEGWNPALQIDAPDTPGGGAGAKAIADAIIEKRGSATGSSKFFDNSAENLVKALAMWERHKKGPLASLRTVRYDLATQNKTQFLATLKAMAESDIQAIAIAAGRLHTRLTDDKSQSTSSQDVIDTALSEMEFLDDPNIGADMVKGGAIPFADMHKEIITVYVVLPVVQLRAQQKWLRLLVNLALAELFKSPPRVATLPPVLFMLDEFGNLGRLPEILNALNIARDYRVQLWMFLQNLQQLRVSYEKEYTYFFAGAGAVSTFNTGDLETAEHFSKLFGNREVRMTSESMGGGSMLTGYLHPKNVSLSQSTSTQVFPLIAPEDLRRLGVGGTANYIEPCPWPVRAEAPGYWKLFDQGALDPNPYYHG